MAERGLLQLLRGLLHLIFWALIFLPIFVLPVYYMLEQPLLRPFISSLMSELTNPASFAFRLIVYPGFTFVVLYATFLVLIERKLAAKVQLRVGPQYAGRFEGILQSFADLLKMLGKEMIVPAGADKPLFLAAPFLATVLAGSLIALVPVSPTSAIANLSYGLLAFFAILSLYPIIVLLAAWSSNNKFTLVGGLRALHQLIAYEVPMLVAALTPALLARSINPLDIAGAQVMRGIPFLMLAPLSAFVFFCCMVAELERIPFDIPEADSEIVAGWLTEYSSVSYLLLYGAAPYIKMYAFAGLFTGLFLGGWAGPSFLPPDLWFQLKAFAVILLVQLLRAVYPRYRMDQLLALGWGRLFVLALVNLVPAPFIAAYLA
ncbi:MAG: NADH-quinone oxidoreductase subunit NuoH [Nitrososphaerota archaeon]